MRYFGAVASMAQEAKRVDHEVEVLRAKSEIAQKKLEIEVWAIAKGFSRGPRGKHPPLRRSEHLKKCYDAVKVVRDTM